MLWQTQPRLSSFGRKMRVSPLSLIADKKIVGERALSYVTCELQNHQPLWSHVKNWYALCLLIFHDNRLSGSCFQWAWSLRQTAITSNVARRKGPEIGATRWTYFWYSFSVSGFSQNVSRHLKWCCRCACTPCAVCYRCRNFTWS